MNINIMAAGCVGHSAYGALPLQPRVCPHWSAGTQEGSCCSTLQPGRALWARKGLPNCS